MAPPSCDDALTTLHGIGPKIAAKLSAERGLNTLRDALDFLPRGYRDFRQQVALSELVVDQDAVTTGFVVAKKGGQRYRGRRRRPLEISLAEHAEGEPLLRALFFNPPPWLVSNLALGESLVLAGRPEQGPKGLQMNHPELGRDESLARLRPRYPPVEGVSQRLLHRMCLQALELCGDGLVDELPHELQDELALPSLRTAYGQLHAAEELSPEDVLLLQRAEAPARRRLVFEELLCLQMGLAARRRELIARKAPRCVLSEERAETLSQLLSFELTACQQQAVAEVLSDCAAEEPMLRLLSGDVGSGKTVVALYAALAAVESGHSAVLLAPTTLLARQHAERWAAVVAPLGVKVALEAGDSQPQREPSPCIVVGTHALLYRDPIEGLGVLIVDEQQRFGVEQRQKLARGEGGVHFLMLSATPIPRTLALLAYGDLSLTRLVARPSRHRPAKTRLVARPLLGPDSGAVLEDMTKRLEAGDQMLVICSRIEGDDDGTGIRAAERRVGELLPEVAVAALHGAMGAEQQHAAVERFRRREAQALVATTVVEVGADFAGVGLLVVERADRFGVAQLHQLRGRIGRGEPPSGLEPLALFFSDAEPGSSGAQRLELLAANDDGFELAAADLRQRGPGELLGKKQSGAPALRYMDFASSDHLQLLERAREIALENQPTLDSGEAKGASS